jgi:hypothetical protein
VRYTYIGLILLTIITFNGCATKKIKTRFIKANNNQLNNFNRTNNYNHFRYKPVIGTKQEDTKVLIDMGQFAKIWVKNYRNKNKTFVASHDIITMIKEPGFIAGEDLPNRRSTIRKSYSGHNFSYRSNDLLFNSNKTSKLKTTQIKDYINNYSEAKKYKKLPTKKIKQNTKIDNKLKKYLKEKRGLDYE